MRGEPFSLLCFSLEMALSQEFALGLAVDGFVRLLRYQNFPWKRIFPSPRDQFQYSLAKMIGRHVSSVKWRTETWISARRWSIAPSNGARPYADLW